MKNEPEIILPTYVTTALDILNRHGYKAYIVGGCVRDYILGREPDDWDITTSSLTDETVEAFSGYRVISTGIKHGTVTVVIDGNNIEITTMRKEGDYPDGRHPDRVSFITDITADLSRRDFTVNAVAYNPSEGFIDPFDGISDIKNKTIRCVGSPKRRFSEDALRILRAIRFSSVLGFEIGDETSEAVLSLYRLLENVSYERKRDELVKIICGVNSENVLRKYRSIIFYLIPELAREEGFPQKNMYHIYDVWTHTLKVVSSAGGDRILSLTALFHDIDKPSCHTTDENGVSHFFNHSVSGAEKTRDIMKRFRFSNSDIKSVTDIITLHEKFPPDDVSCIGVYVKRMLRYYSPDTVRNVFRFMLCDLAGKNPEYDRSFTKTVSKAVEVLDGIIKNNEAVSLKNLEINGYDLINAGTKRDIIGDILDKALNAVIEGKVSNDRESLLNYVKSLIR